MSNTITPFKAKVSGLAVQVPDDAYDIFIGYFSNNLCYRTLTNHGEQDHVDLPPGSWRILGIADELTEEQWKEVVDVRYGVEDTSGMDELDMLLAPIVRVSATESGKSLMASLKVEGRNVILIEK